MAVSKRLRYEILRRDNYQCRYCGASAPDTPLTVDHVVPVALGGSDDPGNLVTACRDCNAGKSASAPDAPLVADVSETALRWAQAFKQAVSERYPDIPDWYPTGEELVEHFDGVWTKYWIVGPNETRIYFARPTHWRNTIRALVDTGLTLKDLAELMRVSVYSDANDVWLYFCKCCWNRVSEYQNRATELVRSGGV